MCASRNCTNILFWKWKRQICFFNGDGNSEKGIKKKSELMKKCRDITPYLKMIGVIIKGTARFLWKTPRLHTSRNGSVTSTLKRGNFEYSKYWIYT